MGLPGHSCFAIEEIRSCLLAYVRKEIDFRRVSWLAVSGRDSRRCSIEAAMHLIGIEVTGAEKRVVLNPKGIIGRR